MLEACSNTPSRFGTLIKAASRCQGKTTMYFVHKLRIPEFLINRALPKPNLGRDSDRHSRNPPQHALPPANARAMTPPIFAPTR
jgi:hypothetical protein